MTLVTHAPGFPVAAPESALTSSLPDRIKAYGNVMRALVLHDIKNRFFGSGLGQIVMVLWPFVHILVLLIIYVVTKRVNPYGESVVQYSAVSVFPFICFNYVTRWIVFSALTNRSFLHYPIIRPLDLLIARAVLECVSISLVGIMLVMMVATLGYDVMPADPTQAAYAVGATLLLSIGVGFFNAVIAFIVPMWGIVISLIILLMYVSCGILFVVSFMPEQFRVPLSYNPLLHCVEWLRSAYYPDYPTLVLDKTYVLEFGLISLALGLVLERVLRRFF